MGLVRLVYASKFNTDKYEASEVANIHSSSKDNNKSDHITGLIVCGNNYFLQCIEGEISNINKLLKTIFNDDRHDDMLILHYSHCDSREFDNWSMKLVLLTDENKKLINKYSGSEDFNPFSMTEHGCLKFLKEIAN